MKSLALTTCLGENTETVCQAMAGYLTGRLGIPVRFERRLSWKERSQQIDSGKITMGWICGLLYVKKVDDLGIPITPLAAPIMHGAAYQQQPVYTSKIIVHRDSDYHSFSDLRGAQFAINEPGSYSGCVLVQAHLAGLGETGAFFGSVVESGAHSQSINWVASGRVAAAAIDCTVYNYILSHDPEIQKKLRVIEVLGPSPVPLWVISNQVPEKTMARIRRLLLNMATNEAGCKILAAGNVLRFTAVADEDYNQIREKAQQARVILWR